jgi:hypothetical protein
MRKGFLIYEEMRKYLVIFEEDVSHILYDIATATHLNFLVYEENLIFFFISVCCLANGALLPFACC